MNVDDIKKASLIDIADEFSEMCKLLVMEHDSLRAISFIYSRDGALALVGTGERKFILNLILLVLIQEGGAYYSADQIQYLKAIYSEHKATKKSASSLSATDMRKVLKAVDELFDKVD